MAAPETQNPNAGNAPVLIADALLAKRAGITVHDLDFLRDGHWDSRHYNRRFSAAVEQLLALRHDGLNWRRLPRHCQRRMGWHFRVSHLEDWGHRIPFALSQTPTVIADFPNCPALCKWRS